jgi:hypothetical protein
MVRGVLRAQPPKEDQGRYTALTLQDFNTLPMHCTATQPWAPFNSDPHCTYTSPYTCALQSTHTHFHQAK